MKRSMCGIVLLAAATALWSCNGDPTGSIRDEGQKIIADPGSLFLNEGESKFVVVELVDGQGNQLAAEFTPQNVGAGVTVEKDTTYLETSTGTPILTSSRFIVTGVTGSATSFDLVSEGESVTVPVKVLPSAATFVFSNPTPAANEPITVTAEGFTFLPGATVAFGADTAVTLSVAEDGSSMLILPPPGVTGAPTISGVEVNFAPGAPLTLTSSTELAVAPVTPLAGTGSAATAPTIPLPAIGDTLRFFDAPDFAASADAFYKITVPAEVGSVDITLNWNSAADIDMIRGVQPGSTACATTFSSTDCDFTAATASKPEHATYTLTPGTYLLIAEVFAGTAPTNIYFQVIPAAPAAP